MSASVSVSLPFVDVLSSIRRVDVLVLDLPRAGKELRGRGGGHDDRRGGEVTGAGRAKAKEGSLEVEDRAGAHGKEDLVHIVGHL